ncbi:acyl carrier protein [Streptomyces brevispora]|uniref:Acyl carrier protein n=1 Tax=Streptomyces brevispora TaxID=887462 RepID=A0A561TYD9_9ACTN|nr:acyl carrier protein [Streptomyces brevispora]TWF92131.1 act minimal PKS acyl carrier protein [Streptomyces brevispora]WSC11564.1 acyl carrier protein [Streptomyces brevispora]WSC17547.1 acyl carrier protein [Streptomyces brevispora]
MALQQITIGDLQTIMLQCAGEAEDALSLEEAPDRAFEELGYDSLALLETYSRLERDFGIELCEDELDAINTARQLVDFVNSLLQLKVLSAA